MTKIKKMCKVKEDKFKDIKNEVMKEVKEPKYICKKCLRVSTTEDILCKPTIIE